MEEKSKLEIAYDYVESRTKVSTFKQIWAYICKVKGLSEEEAAKQVSIFYSSLLQDGRFISIGDGKIDLKKRYSSKAHKKYDKLVAEFENRSAEDESDFEEEDDDEEKEFAQEENHVRDDFGYADDKEETKQNDNNDEEK